MRVTARAALSLAAIGITIGAALTPASSALAASVPTISANPNTGLSTHPALTIKPSNGAVNGGRLRVSGKGFPAGVRIDLMECSALHTTFGCDVKTFKTSKKTNASGAFPAVYVRVYAGKTTKRSCNAGGKCYLIVGTISKAPNAKNTAEAFFTFATKKATRVTVAVHGHHLVGKVRAAGRGVRGLKAVVERNVGHTWKKVGLVRTHRHGAYSSRNFSHPGKYRVHVPRQRLRGTIFKSSTSKIVKLTH
jgi:hypothetical protein